MKNLDPQDKVVQGIVELLYKYVRDNMIEEEIKCKFTPLYFADHFISNFIESGVAELNEKQYGKDGCMFIAQEAFAYSDDFETVEFSDSALNIGSYAFYDTGDDMAVTFDNCRIDMDDNAFQSCGIISLAINSSDTVLGKETFAYCEDLTDVVFGSNNVKIGSYAFYDCTALTNVSIAAESTDDNLEIVIDDSAFQSCAVQNVEIGRGNVELGDEAFAYSEKLVSVEFKGDALKVGKDAFYDCPDELAIMYKGVKYNKQSIEDAM